MTSSYEIYKNAVGSVTMNGDKMREFDNLPENIKKAWCAIDEHYATKIEILNEIIADMNGNSEPCEYDSDACDCKACRNIRCSVCRGCWKTVEDYIHH